MNDIIPTLTHATERDIDLLVVEEAIANRDFVEWIASHVGMTKNFDRWEVLHSKRRTRSRREIDICLETFSTSGAPIWVILIENKLDAEEQPDQAESYRKELELHYDGHQDGRMVLICPEGYASTHSPFAAKFDATIHYERISEFFQRLAGENSEAGRRSSFRQDCLDQAIHKFRRGYRKISNPIIKDFNAQYVELLRKIAPELKPGRTMLAPDKPNESVSMILDNVSLRDLPDAIRPRRFSIELGKGKASRANYAAVTFAGWGHAKAAMEAQLKAEAKDNLTRYLNLSLHAKPPTKTRPSPGLVLTTPTCPVDNQGDFSAQKDLIADGMLKARLLLEWLESHKPLLFELEQMAHNS